MRLGGYFNANCIEELEPLCEKLDAHGLSAISAPRNLYEMSEEEVAAFGECATQLGLVVGEGGFWENLMTDDGELRAGRIETVRGMLQEADAMGCHCIVTLVGTKDASDDVLAPHPYMYSEQCKAEFREVVLRILDGLELRKT